jgi:hypothetical protein
VTDIQNQREDDESTQPSEDTATAAKRRKMGWADPFELEIFDAILKPKLAAILAEGVRNRTHLCKVWSENFGCDVGQDRMQRWLERMGLGELFGNKPLIRVPIAPQAAPLPQNDPSPWAPKVAPLPVGMTPPVLDPNRRPFEFPNPAATPGVSIGASDFGNDPRPVVTISG